MASKLRDVSIKEFSSVYSEVLAYFFAFPDQAMVLSTLSRAIGCSKTYTKLAVEQLSKEKFLSTEEVGRAWRITVNGSHQYLLTRKLPNNLRMIYESGLIDAVHNKVPNARTIILFGSYRYGSDNEKSDIDIGVEIISDKPLHIEELGIINKLGYRKNVRVNLHVFSRSHINLNLFTNIANGVILDGILEVKP